MQTCPSSTEVIDLGVLSVETRRRLKEVKATWLEFMPDPPRLRVRADQTETAFTPRAIAGDLLEFLGYLPQHKRSAAALEALRHLDAETGQCLLRLLERLAKIEGLTRSEDAARRRKATP